MRYGPWLPSENFNEISCCNLHSLYYDFNIRTNAYENDCFNRCASSPFKSFASIRTQTTYMVANVAELTNARHYQVIYLLMTRVTTETMTTWEPMMAINRSSPVWWRTTGATSRRQAEMRTVTSILRLYRWKKQGMQPVSRPWRTRCTKDCVKRHGNAQRIDHNRCISRGAVRTLRSVETDCGKLAWIVVSLSAAEAAAAATPFAPLRATSRDVDRPTVELLWATCFSVHRTHWGWNKVIQYPFNKKTVAADNQKINRL